MWGVITHVSSTKIKTALTNTLKNIPDTLGLAPYLPSILDSRSQIIQAFRRFPTTAFQSSPKAVKTLPTYLKHVTIFSCLE